MTAASAVLLQPMSRTIWLPVLLVPGRPAISIVDKTLKCENLREVPIASIVVLCITIVAGMYAVGVGLWAVYLLLA
jgi:hypothetical protein